MDTKDTKLFTIAQIRLLESLAVTQFGVSEQELMHRAARAALCMMRKTWPHVNKVVVICGKGNNGGDGYVLAQLACQEGLQVFVRYLEPPEKKQLSAWQAFEACQKMAIALEKFCPAEQFNDAVIVDALIGIGLKSNVKENYLNAINALNNQQLPILSIDVPSGLNADTGAVLGAAINAALTITFIGLKRGLFTAEGVSCSGKVHLDDLGLPKNIFNECRPSAILSTRDLISTYLPERKRNSHKGDFGHVFILGGNLGMGGAPRLAAQAALRVGAGLVSVITRPENISIINAQYPEVMVHGCQIDQDLMADLKKATVIVIGPGLGQCEWGNYLLKQALQSSSPKVVDADALNLLAGQEIKRNDWVLTPHPGEAARLLNNTISQIQEDRFLACEKLVAKFGGASVLKGAGTLTQHESDLITVCPYGNPGMASAGMGDALSGIIGGLIAQRLPLKICAQLGVLIHALAGDIAAQKGERGLLATDLISKIRLVVNKFF